MGRFDEEEEVVSETEECPNCRLAQDQWSNKAKGYNAAGETYCCEECAEDRGCICPGDGMEALPAEVDDFENASQRPKF